MVPEETLDDALELLPELFIPHPATLQVELPPTDALPEELETDADVGCCDVEGALGNGWCPEDAEVDGVVFDDAAEDIGIELPERTPKAALSTKTDPELFGS